MKIDNQVGPLANLEIKKTGEQPLVKPAASEPEGRPEKPQSGDVVELSDRARLAARATELAQEAPEVRQDKVADLKARIGAGTYNVSAQVVAEAVIRKSITEV
jgi:negative regulator of flagellin synthesis FlgM